MIWRLEGEEEEAAAGRAFDDFVADIEDVDIALYMKREKTRRRENEKEGQRKGLQLH